MIKRWMDLFSSLQRFLCILIKPELIINIVAKWEIYFALKRLKEVEKGFILRCNIFGYSYLIIRIFPLKL